MFLIKIFRFFVDILNVSVPNPDAINLIELSERIKNSAKRKKLEKENISNPSDILELPLPLSNIGEVERISNPRRRYQEYFQTRQHAAVMIDEYLASQPILREQQVIF